MDVSLTVCSWGCMYACVVVRRPSPSHSGIETLGCSYQALCVPHPMLIQVPICRRSEINKSLVPENLGDTRSCHQCCCNGST